MRKRKDKNTGITLIALVITIVIMLLLAGVALQMTMGENGLIGKSVQAQKAQAKSELYETAKLSYANLRAKAAENGQPNPQVELALSTTEFRDRYDIVGDDITDKNGNVIDTKVNVLNVIQGTVAGGFSSGGTTAAESWPKTVGGVTIPGEDKDKMIWKLKVKNDTNVVFGNPELRSMTPIEVDFGNGQKEEITDLYEAIIKHYSRGEYILKFKNVRDISMVDQGEFEIEVLQWGKIVEKNEENIFRIYNVSKIYEPEPDRIPIIYSNPKFTEIPEWLFSKKITSTVMSKFGPNNNITSIPEGLFKNNVNVRTFLETFDACTGITNIPEGLFKNNVNVITFSGTFYGCTGLTSIPEGLFRYNVNATSFLSVFDGCTGLTSIPEGLFNNNVNATNFSGTFQQCRGLTSIPEGLFKNNVNATDIRRIFYGCTGLTSIPEGLFRYNVNVTSFNYLFFECKGLTSIPEGLFNNNVNVTSFEYTFSECIALTSIPEGLFKNNVNVNDFRRTFLKCTGLTSIPEGLFKNNVNATKFEMTFEGCIGLTSIPEGLFKNNLNTNDLLRTFARCTGLTNIPETIVEFAKKVKERGGDTSFMFWRCTSASNYTSIPEYMK